MLHGQRVHAVIIQEIARTSIGMMHIQLEEAGHSTTVILISSAGRATFAGGGEGTSQQDNHPGNSDNSGPLGGTAKDQLDAKFIQNTVDSKLR
jgi:hypothetical protein